MQHGFFIETKTTAEGFPSSDVTLDLGIRGLNELFIFRKSKKRILFPVVGASQSFNDGHSWFVKAVLQAASSHACVEHGTENNFHSDLTET